MVPETLTYFGNDLDSSAQQEWVDYPHGSKNIFKSNGCYSGFIRYLYKIGLNYYFIFPAVPIWIEELIAELNSTFKNIKYTIVSNKSLYYRTSNSLWGSGGLELSNNPNKGSEVYCPIFTVEVSDKYSELVRPFLLYVLHHILRMTSIIEKYVPETYYSKRPENKSLIDYVLSINNIGKSYRSLAEIKLTIEDLLRLDDIDNVNTYLSINPKGHLTQTEIFMNLDWNNYSSIPKGALVTEKSRDAFYPPIIGILLAVKKSGMSMIEDIINRNIITVYSPVVEIKLIENNENTKFKVGEWVTPKTKYEYMYPRKVKVFKNYSDGIFSAGSTEENAVLLWDKAFKRIPKTQYRLFGI